MLRFAQGTAAEEDEIDLRRYWSIARRNLWGIVGFALAMAVLAALVAFSMTPEYRSRAILLIESQEANVVSIEEVYGLDTRNSEYYETQFEILKSRRLAERVIRALGLEHHPELDPLQQSSLLGDAVALLRGWVLPAAEPLTEAAVWEATVENFRDRLEVEPIRNTQLVEIAFTAYDAGLTARVANAIGQAYIEDNLEARLAMTQQAAEWLSDRLGTLRENLRRSEEALQSFREREQLVDVQGVTTLNARELDELTSQLVEARKMRSDLEARINQIRNADDDKLATITVILETRIVQQAKEADTQAQLKVAELSKRYGPKHPRMIAAMAELQAAEANLRRQVRKVADGFEEQYQRAVANERALEAALERSKSEVQSISRKEYQLNELEREVEANRRLYDMFFTRMKETSETDFQAANARITDPAVTPMAPVAPRKSLIVGGTFALSLLLGVAVALLREQLDNTIKNAADVEERLGEPMLGLLPLMKDKRRKHERSSLAYLDEGQRAFAESIRTIRTGVFLSGLDRPHKVIVVTSSAPGEGKTTVASNLSLALAQMEKAVLVDADMRRPSVGKDFGVTGAQPGLSNLVAGECSLEACVTRAEDSRLDVISAGFIVPNPLELLSSHRFKDVIATLSERYDRVIIDSAPVQVVSDALVLATSADGVIYVVRADVTPVHVVRSGLGRLRNVNQNIIGVVLNQVDTGARARYYAYSDYGYYDSYGYESNEARAKREAA